jgi:rhodanese-related sulfurtransferase
VQIGAGVLLDVRSREAFARARAPGAVNVPVEELDTLGDVVARDASLLLVDANGQLLRAVARRIRGFGFRVSEVSGGMTAWRLTGLPLEGTAHGGDDPAV